MSRPTPDSLDWSIEKMAQYFALPAGKFYFVGGSCGKCKKTANVAHDAGWFCPCGAFNELDWSVGFYPHETPDYGPTASAIREAVRLASAAQSPDASGKDQG